MQRKAGRRAPPGPAAPPAGQTPAARINPHGVGRCNGFVAAAGYTVSCAIELIPWRNPAAVPAADALRQAKTMLPFGRLPTPDRNIVSPAAP